MATFNARKVIEKTVTEILNEQETLTDEDPRQAAEVGKQIRKEMMKKQSEQEEIQDLEARRDASLLTKAGRKVKELADTPITGKHAAMVLSAIAAGLGAMQLAKKLRQKKTTSKKA